MEYQTSVSCLRVPLKDCNGNGIPDHCEPEGEVDTIPPTFVTTVSNITKSTDPNSCSALVGWLTPIAEDACDSAPLVSADHLNGSAFNLGTTTVTVTAEDNYGNSDYEYLYRDSCR